MSGDVEMVVHTGRFKGKTVEECPTWWLKWAAVKWKERTPQDKELMNAVNTELEFRARHGA
ncbi:MAG: hypothetical protein K9K66_04305 [Desulfarculaceae bacterium]|nr:hypothetical protein [Desulfarculaceae bacterium]MCF8073265.1 hypothetical protein [Desulfarculaceae bacterium]MCF8100861.1 hypothetical protein [Desulfarculaceae bacterium]